MVKFREHFNEVQKLRCDATGKVMYRSEAGAKKAAGQFAASRGLLVRLEAYECPHCEEWHLGNGTSGKRLFAAVRQDIERIERGQQNV